MSQRCSGREPPHGARLGKCCTKPLGRAGRHVVNALDCGWASVTDCPKEREGACLCILYKDVNLCRTRERKCGCPSPRWCQQLPAPLRAGGGKILQILLLVPEQRSPHAQVPSHSSSRAPAASRTPAPKKMLGRTGLEPACFSLISPSLPLTPLLFFQEWAKCPGVTALQPLITCSKPRIGTCGLL